MHNNSATEDLSPVPKTRHSKLEYICSLQNICLHVYQTRSHSFPLSSARAKTLGTRLHAYEILEEVELSFEALHALDSNVRKPQYIFCDLLTAKRILQNNVKTCSRTPKVLTGTAIVDVVRRSYPKSN